MEKGINVFTEDPAEQAEYSFVGDIKTECKLYEIVL
jgi:hypothetical protein